MSTKTTIKDDPCSSTAPSDPAYNQECDDKPRDIPTTDGVASGSYSGGGGGRDNASVYARGGPVGSPREYKKKSPFKL